MKHIYKFSVIIPILVFLSFGLMISSNDTASHIGKILITIVVPIAVVALVGIGIAMSVLGKGSNDANKNSDEQSNEQAEDYDEDNIAVGDLDSNQISAKSVAGVNVDEKEQERADIEAINNSYGYDNLVKQDEFIAKHAAKSFKNASKSEKVKSILFLAFLLIDFALIFVFGYLGITFGAIACVCLFGGTIIVAMIAIKISEKISMRKIDINSGKYEIACGTVLNCSLSHTTYVGGRRSSSRMVSIVYRLKISAKGNEYVAYSTSLRSKGEIVMIAILGKKRAAVVDGDELVEKFDDEENKLEGNVGKFDDKDNSSDNLTF